MEIINWSAIETGLAEHGAEVEYLTISERVNRKEERLGRLNLPEDLWGEERCRFALDWLDQQIRRVATGQHRTGFRVYLYGPKASNKHTFTITAVDEDPEEVLAEVTVQSVADEVERRSLFKLERAWESLVAQLMSRTGQIVELSMTVAQQADQIARNQAQQAAEESRAARQQVTDLVNANTHRQIAEAQAKAELVTLSAQQRAAEEEKTFKSDLARDALGQLGGLANAIMMRQAGLPPIDPELSEVLASLQSSPELMDALKQPNVRAQLKDPHNLRTLAELLKATGEANFSGGPDAQPAP